MSNAQLEKYKGLLIKWQKTINLVGPDTLHNVTKRHFDDSAQLADLIPDGPQILFDLGSGAGFPGMVLAMLRPELKIHLIESDHRKSTFLSTVSRETMTPVTIYNERVERLSTKTIPDIITARALAPLDKLLGYAASWAAKNPDLILLFMKGERAGEEVAAAQELFDFDVQTVPSKTDPAASILKITNLRTRKKD